jgi:hypothetical protein
MTPLHAPSTSDLPPGRITLTARYAEQWVRDRYRVVGVEPEWVNEYGETYGRTDLVAHDWPFDVKYVRLGGEFINGGDSCPTTDALVVSSHGYADDGESYEQWVTRTRPFYLWTVETWQWAYGVPPFGSQAWRPCWWAPCFWRREPVEYRYPPTLWSDDQTRSDDTQVGPRGRETRNPMRDIYGPGPVGSTCGGCKHLTRRYGGKLAICELDPLTSSYRQAYLYWLGCARFEPGTPGQLTVLP